METHRPAPGEELNPGAPTEPRQAASVIILRGGSGGLEVLLLRRNPAARFMPGAWVFPGGAVDAHEGAGDASHRAAAVREVAEEAGLTLPDPAALVKFSRWITPAEIAIRFDTHFFLAHAPPGQEPRADGQEMVDLGWYTPQAALDASARGELELVFPTIKHLEQLAPFPTADRLIEWATGREVVAVEPRVRITGETSRVVLPGEPGYDTSPKTSGEERARSSGRRNRSPWVGIGVPVDSVGRAGGTEHAPAAVRRHGLLDRLGARDAGDLDVRIRGDARDPDTGVVGIAGVLGVTTAVRAAVRDAIGAGDRPLVLGGCCSLVPGALAGVRDATGAAGVAYVDGHVDVYDGRTSPTGEAADMPLGVAFGRAPKRWVDAAGGPAADPASVVVLGARDPEEADDIAPLLAGELAALTVLGPAELRAAGLASAGERTAARLGRFWIHLDVDVLDEVAMPATDYLMPGGLDWDELAALLAPLCAAPGLAGLSLGCLNPEKDPDGSATRRTCDLLAVALAAA
jgi:arginase family enzyme/8-oxo-dGTP pyrophosphatase MutT (NUDIX family)